jgi:two-component system LytT family sensor kinase
LKNRLYFYFFISFACNALNFLKDLEDETVLEALIELTMTFPLTFTFILLIFLIRKKVTTSNIYNFSKKKNSGRLFFWLFLISIQSLGFGFLFRSISMVLFDDDGDNQIFDLIFWAIVIGIVCVIVFVYILENLIEAEVEKLEITYQLKELENEKTAAQYQSLKNQLNPHFLFNCFNSLINLIKHSPEKAEFFVLELAKIYRYNLEKSEEIVVTLESEMVLVHSYMELKKIRFGESLILKEDIDVDKLSWCIPPLTLELLIENAIKHNSFDKASPLEICFFTHNDTIIVENTYLPKTQSKHENSLGIGIKNLINQYKLISDKIPTFTILNGKFRAQVPLIQDEI